jgi:hypothetical protein
MADKQAKSWSKPWLTEEYANELEKIKQPWTEEIGNEFIAASAEAGRKTGQYIDTKIKELGKEGFIKAEIERLKAFIDELKNPSKEERHKYTDAYFNELIEVSKKGIASYNSMLKDIENTDSLKIKSEALVNTKYPVNFLTPTDKVTLRAFENKLTGRQMQKLGMERRGSKKQITTLASIDFDKLDGSVQIKGRKELTAYDREVHDAIITLYIDGGNEYITPQMIYQVMTGNPDAYLHPKQAEAISESITKCMYTRLIIYASEEAKEYGFDSFKYDGNLIIGERVTATLNGTVLECLHILRPPGLYEYANKKNQIGRFDIKLLNSPIKKTEEIITLQGYLYRRILSMKNKKSNLSKTIVYDTVYKQIDVTAASDGALRKKKSKLRDQVKKILDYWKQEKFIAGYVENKRGKRIYSVTIRL